MFPYADAASMFFAGLILLIPHRIGMSRVNYVIKRYNLPISRAGLLLYKYHNNIELSLFIGTLSGNIIIWPTLFANAPGTTGDKETDEQKEKTKVLLRIFMIIFLFLMLLSSIIMYKIYISGGDFGHLNSFYFSLIFLTLFDGFTNAFAFCINGKQSSMLAAGIPLSGALVTLLHNNYESYSFKNGLDDFDYHVLRLQLLWNIILISICLILWTVDQTIDMILILKTGNNFASGGNCHTQTLSNLFTSTVTHEPKTWNNGSSTPNFDCPHMIRGSGYPKDLFNANLSPIGMLAISLGTVYAFYPSIAPYSIIDFQYAAVIELWILIISAIIPFIIALLDFINTVVHISGKDDYGIGPGSVKENWGTRPWWHCVWICAIPYILCIQIFMSLLHYPDCLLSCFFNHPRRIQFISVLFNTLRELMQATGFAGAGKQCNGMDGGVASLNKLITLFVMMFCVFTGDGYLQHYRRCCRDCWPTTGYNKYQSFFYWLHFGFKGGIKSITSSFTDLYYHNLRPQFISYA